MSDQYEPFDPLDILRDAVPDATPNQRQTKAARAALQQAIATERQSRTPPVGARLLPRVAFASVVFLLAIVSLSLVLSRGDSATATLQEIAQAARQAEPADIPAEGFLLRESLERNLRILPGSELGVDRQFVAYSIETERSIWRNPQARFVQMRIVNRDPWFYDDEVAQGYVNEGMSDVDTLGQPVTERFTDVVDPILETPWSESPHQLRSQIIDAIGRGDTANTTSFMLFDFVIDMLTEPITPPVRGAVIELLATLDLNQVTRNTDGSVRLQIEDHNGMPTRHTIVLRADGTLLSREIVLLAADPELGLPAGTVTSSATYSRWTEVADIRP
jgi:hypothetical protein